MFFYIGTLGDCQEPNFLFFEIFFGFFDTPENRCPVRSCIQTDFRIQYHPGNNRSKIYGEKSNMAQSKTAGSAAKRPRAAGSQTKIPVVGRIVDNARDVYTKIDKNQKPTMSTPIRSLANVKYIPKKGHFEMLGKTKKRTLTVGTVKTFAQTLKMMALSKELIETDDMATKREAYYISKNWGKAGFDEQPESDTIMDDIEAMFGVNREQLKFVPEEKGGDVAGRLFVLDRDGQGRKLKIDCTKFGSGAYSIPVEVEQLQFESKAKFILAIETAGMFQRLVKYDYWDKTNCILVSMGGVPTRAARRFIRRLSDTLKIPVYAFVDGDPYGYFNIYRTP